MPVSLRLLVLTWFPLSLASSFARGETSYTTESDEVPLLQRHVSRSGGDSFDWLCAALKLKVGIFSVKCGESAKNYNLGAYNPRCNKLVAAYVVTPTKAEHVQAAVRLSREYNRTFSVRGGGHSYVCNSMQAGSVHLDMRQMLDFSFHEAGGFGYARIGPGHVLHDIQSLIPAGFQYAIGTCPTVGVVGYYIHGGSSPRTKWLGNETIYSMDVVTANATMLTLNSSSPYEDLWVAMRQAGSSFAVVTSLTVRLPAAPQKNYFRIPVKGTYDVLLQTILAPSFVETVDALGIWIGLFRFDQINPLRSGWSLKVASTPFVHGRAGSTDDFQGTGSFVDEDLVRRLQSHTRDTGSEAGLASLRVILRVMASHALELDLARLEPLDGANRGINDLTRGVNQDGVSTYSSTRHLSGELVSGLYGPIKDAGSTGGFFIPDGFEEKALAQEEFFQNRTQSCWFDLGPIKGPEERIFLDNTCFTPEAVTELQQFLAAHPELVADSKYYNLPIWTTPREEYWPTYDELAFVKTRWDPTGFFDIPDGIHLPGQAWPSRDPFKADA